MSNLRHIPRETLADSSRHLIFCEPAQSKRTLTLIQLLLKLLIQLLIKLLRKLLLKLLIKLLKLLSHHGFRLIKRPLLLLVFITSRPFGLSGFDKTAIGFDTTAIGRL